MSETFRSSDFSFWTLNNTDSSNPPLVFPFPIPQIMVKTAFMSLTIDEFVGPPIGFFREKNKFSHVGLQGMSRQKGRKGDGKIFLFDFFFQDHRTYGSTVNSPHTVREAHVWYPCDILGVCVQPKNPACNQVIHHLV